MVKKIFKLSKKTMLLSLIGVFLLSGCIVPPGQIKKQTAPGQIKKHTGYNPASGKFK
ncbi:MAG: hypothetical protein ACE5KZ_08840 [Candidatus Scalinduaceae bacterium]